MDFNHGFILSQKKDFKVQIPWPPATPAKSNPLRTPIPDNGQSNPSKSWLDTILPETCCDRFPQERIYSRTDSCGYSDGLQYLQGTEAATLPFNSQFQNYPCGSYNTGTSMPPFSNSVNNWAHQMPFLNLMAYTDAAAVSQNPFFMPQMFSQMGRGVDKQALHNQLLLNNQLLLKPSQFNVNKNLSMKALLEQSHFDGDNGSIMKIQNEAAFPFSPNSNILIEKTVDLSGSSAMPYPFTPLTHEKNKSMPNQIPSEVINLEDDSETEGNLWNKKQVNLCFWTPAHPSSDPVIPSLSESILPPDTAIPQQNKSEGKTVHSSENNIVQQIDAENHGNLENNNDIDLNKTPRQKPKRKKHRPKVIKEVKPTGARNLATLKPATPKTPKIKEENPSGKRKYVRKKKVDNPTEKTSMMPGERDDPNNVVASKSVRRCLNFDFKVLQAKDQPSGSPMMFGCYGACQEQVKISQGKRKYVRRKKVDDTTEKASRALEDTADQNKKKEPKSVRQCFNFDSEVPQVTNEHPGFSMSFLSNKACQGQEAWFVDTTSSSNSMSSSHLVPGTESVVDKSATKVTFDLNSSLYQNIEYIRDADQMPTTKNKPCISKKANMDQMLDDWSTMPKSLTPSSQPSRGELVKEKLIHLSGKSDYLSFNTNYDKSRESGTTQVKSNEILHPSKKKKKDDLNNDAQVPTSKSIIQAYDGNSGCPYLPQGYKKRRATPERNRFVYTTTSSTAYMSSNDALNDRLLLDKAELFPSSIDQLLQTPEKQQISKCKLSFKQAEECNLIKTPEVQSVRNGLTYINNSSNRTLDQQNSSACARMSTSIGNRESQGYEPDENSLASARISTCIVNEQSQLDEPQRSTNVKLGDGSTTKKLKRHSKKEKAQIGIPLINADRPSSYDIEPCSSQQMPRNENASADSTVKKLLTFGSMLEDISAKNIKETFDGSLASRNLVLYGDPIDDIIQKLRFLSLNGPSDGATTQPQNAIVPYEGGGTMVPYGSLKKRRPRPKVDLDPETNRVWNLLMGKEGGEGVDGGDSKTQRWWEEERQVFHGRVDSFIARMHLVQGDRRFSKWKGSVVDSVVGVFLTQNVSDHLSSSAFMALAAKFPLNSGGKNRVSSAEKNSLVVHPESFTVVHDGTNLRDQILEKKSHSQGPIMFTGDNETANTNESLGSNDGSCEASYSKASCLHTNEMVPVDRQSPDSGSGTPVTLTGSTSEIEADDRWSLEDVLSSQYSVISSQNFSHNPLIRKEQFGLSSSLNVETEDLTNGRPCSGMDNVTSFSDLLLMADKITSTTYYGGIGWIPGTRDKMSNSSLGLSSTGSWNSSSICTSGINVQITEHDTLSATPHFYANEGTSSRFLDKENLNIPDDGSRFYQHQTAFEKETTSKIKSREIQGDPLVNERTELTDQKLETVAAVDLYATTNKNNMCMIAKGNGETCLRNQFHSHDKLPTDVAESSIGKSSSSTRSYLEHQNNANSRQTQNLSNQAAASQVPLPMQNIFNQQNTQKLHGKQRFPLEVPVTVELNEKADDCRTVSAITPNCKPRVKKIKGEAEKKKSFDWDTLRKAVHPDGYMKKERSHDTMDSVDWEAVRCADVSKISETIRERGMNNMLAERIKEFLNRLVRDHGSINLEWLREVEPDKAKDYLLSIRGLGLKSVECVRLLTLHHLAFPVDTNVGRICVRLGWVPLQPLPESLQLHLLELYPILETIQKYLWPRLCKLDQRTLYELHYQMITFGKVFCTKSKPNCNACPMRGECKHFASAFASARLALPGPEEKGLVSSTASNVFDKNHKADFVPAHLHLEGGGKGSEERSILANCAPIIEEPTTPEAEFIETEESAIEDAFYEDPDEIPMIKLNFEEFAQNLQDYIQANNMEIQDGDMSKALVAISPDDASIPMPKLKNISRLRTEHYVYELPDSHPLLEGFERREADDPSSYLLAIWTPGETAQSIEPLQESCNSQETGKLCSRLTCFTCNSIREAQSQTVRGTILIPCRTAMRGSFPLNGTYFQVNEMFADHATSRNPIDVPRSLIWNLPRRTVYFGTSVPTIFKGLRTEEIQQCFWRGFVCVRGFDRETRAPKPLYARLHFPASKAPKGKKPAVETAE